MLLPWLTEFHTTHPALTLRLFLSDQVTDVFRDPVDVAFRLGRFDDARYVTLPLAPGNRRMLVAAPAYLEAHGTPQTLDALRRHTGLLYTLAGRTHDQWVFEVDGRRQVIPMRGTLLSDDAEITRRWALAGQGIAYKSWLDVCGEVRDGRLVARFAEHGENVPLHLGLPPPQAVLARHPPTARPAATALRIADRAAAGALNWAAPTADCLLPTIPMVGLRQHCIKRR